MRDAHHACGQTLLLAVELADLDVSAQLGVLHRHPAEREVLAQRRAAGAAGDHAHPLAADVDLVAMAGGLIALELEADESPLRMGGALGERLLSGEVVLGVELAVNPMPASNGSTWSSNS